MSPLSVALLTVALLLVCALPAVARGGGKIPQVAVEELVGESVRASLPGDLRLLDLSLPVRPLPGATTASIHWTSAPRAGRMSVLVTLHAQEREIGRTWARLHLATLWPVLVAHRDLHPGDTVAVGDLEVARLAVDEGVGLLLAPAALVGALVFRDLRAGLPLGRGDISLPPPVTQGAPVRIVVRRAGVVASIDGTLERAARPGESAVVRVAADRPLIRGTLLDRSTLLVSERAP